MARGATPRWLAGGLALAGLVVLVGSVLVWGSRGFPPLAASFASGMVSVGVGILTSLCYLGVGWLLATRTARNPIGWLFLGVGLVLACIPPIGLLVEEAQQVFRPAPASTLALAWAFSSFATPFLVGSVLVAGLLFPDGRLFSTRWRPAVALSVASVAVLGLSAALDPAGLVWYPTLPNPLAAPVELRPVLGVLRVTGVGLLILVIVLLVGSLAARYRRGDATLRAQTRWVVYAAAVQALTFLPFVLARYVVGASDAVGDLFVSIAHIGSAGLPVAAAFAITRYRLFGIDFIIGRTLVYVPLMAVLGGMYTASVAIFQRLFVAVTGGTSDAALLITIFLVATAFTPVRKGLEAAVDRWIGAGRRHVSAGEPSRERLNEVAAALIALRVAERDAQLSSAGPGGRRLAVDAAGLVRCPLAAEPIPSGRCLGCPHLGAILAEPATVICDLPTGAT